MTGAICAALCCFLSSAAPSAPIPNPCDQGPIPIAEWKGIDARHPQFRFPTLICTNPTGDVYLLDQDTYRILQFSPDGAFRKTWELPGDQVLTWFAMAAGDSFLYASSSGGTFQFYPDGSVAQWNFTSCPNGLAVDAEGNLFVSSPPAKKYARPEIVYVERNPGVDREGQPPQLRDRLDVLPREEREGLWKLSSQGKILEHWKAPAWPIALGKEGAIYAVEPEKGDDFMRIHGAKTEYRECALELGYKNLYRSIAVSENGHIFVNDHKKVVEMDARGRVLRRWCELGPAFDPIKSPVGLTLDSEDNLYVIDHFKNRVLKLRIGDF